MDKRQLSSEKLLLNIRRRKSKILKYSTENTSAIIFVGKTPEEFIRFTYLKSILDKREISDTSRQGKDWQNKGYIVTSEGHMELKTTGNQYQSVLFV